MPSAGFEAATPASERPQTLALDRSATGIGKVIVVLGIEPGSSSSLPNFGSLDRPARS
jgi:hypothetical protein